MKSLNRWLAVAALGASIGTGPVAVAGQELPPEIQVDLYMVRADRHLQNQEWVAALEALDVVLALQAANDMETPDALWFQHAEVAMEAGYPETAVASLTRYLVETGREGRTLHRRAEAVGRGGETRRGRRAIGSATARRTAARRTTACRTAARPRHRLSRPPPVDPVDPVESEDRFTVLFPLIGMNAATMSFSSGGPVVPDASYLNGISGGGAVAFPLPFMDEMFDVQIGAHYSQKGTRVTQVGGDGATANIDVAFQSLDISALARVSPPQVANLPQLPFYALIGPYASLELDCSVTPRRDRHDRALHHQRRVRQRESGHAARRFRAHGRYRHRDGLGHNPHQCRIPVQLRTPGRRQVRKRDGQASGAELLRRGGHGVLRGALPVSDYRMTSKYYVL